MDKQLAETNFIIYENEDGDVVVDVVLKDETIWITQKGMAELFGVKVPAISKHLDNIYLDKELTFESTVSKMEMVRKEGNRNVKRNLEFYNLDAIIAVGYRVNSKKATQFRIWATQILKDYMIKGFVIDKEKMKNGPKFGKDYFDELLETIKEIRLSERRQYQKITDIFESTSADYNAESEDAYTFFKIVQNKLHYAITGKTAAELIYERVDSSAIHMGLTNWKNSPNGKIYKYDIGIAKNYLNEKEMKDLERLTISFLDYAEDMAYEHKVMTMKDWIDATNDLLKFRKKQVLNHSGKISHKQAITKANEEYEKYRIKQDEEYISSMDKMYQKYLKENN
ncbi:virulence RhuM family protein [Longibaculum muris]|uniref:virulence RhuM family protein n=1 Tax=Longibaculum muris TaxID=1796628 RepID=UPI0022E88258|nr:virulence RhuM family protein [Longibaculum muris]